MECPLLFYDSVSLSLKLALWSLYLTVNLASYINSSKTFWVIKKWVYELFARVCKGSHRRAQFDFSPMLCDLWVVLSCYNDESCDNLLFPLRDSILLDESMLSPQFTVSCGISLYAVPGSPSLWPVRKLAAPQECPGACSHCPGFSHPERAAAALGS